MKRYIRSAVFAGLLFLTACKGAEQSKEDGYKSIVDDYAEIMLQRDSDSAEYDRALDAVGSYLKKQDDETLQSARTFLGDTISHMRETSEEIMPYQMEDDFSKLLREYSIDPEEYMMNADERGQNLSDYIEAMEILDEYLGYEEENFKLHKALTMEYEMDVKIQDVMRSYDYCGMNYWFAGWGEEEQEYIRQMIYEKLTSFEAEEVWQDDRDAVEERMQMYLNELEELTGEWANYLGEYQEELYRMEQGEK